MAKLYHFVTARQSPAVGDELRGDCCHPFTAVGLSRSSPPLSNRCPDCNTTKYDPVPPGHDVFYVAEEVVLLPGEVRNPRGLIGRLMADARVRVTRSDSEVPQTQEEVLAKAKEIRDARLKGAPPPEKFGGKILQFPKRRKSEEKPKD